MSEEAHRLLVHLDGAGTPLLSDPPHGGTTYPKRDRRDAAAVLRSRRHMDGKAFSATFRAGIRQKGHFADRALLTLPFGTRSGAVSLPAFLFALPCELYLLRRDGGAADLHHPLH